MSTSTLRQRVNKAEEEEPQPSSNTSLGASIWVKIGKSIAALLLLTFLTSQLITQSWLFGYEINWNKVIPRKQIYLTEQELKRYDGSDPNLPIYVAIDGHVFDVSPGRDYYGPGGSYHFFAGRDAARAYTTGCFETHLTHDLRGLSPDQIKDVEGWVKFYLDHPKYFKVGRVLHPPIDPSSPIPPDCHAKDAKGKKSSSK